MHAFLRGLEPTLHIAHRGGAAVAPENTVAAFDLAVGEYGTDMLEIDVQTTRDGVIVVCHDDDLARTTGVAGRIAEMAYDEVERLDAAFSFSADGGQTHPFRGQGVTVPTFEEVLRRYPEMRFNVEVKAGQPDLSRAFAEVVRRAGAVDRVCCGSEADVLAAALLEALPEGCHFYPRLAATAFVVAARTGMAPDPSPYQVLDLPASVGAAPVVDAALVDAAGEAGRWLNVWTVDERPEMEALLALGVGGIMTDRPDVLRAVLDAR